MRGGRALCSLFTLCSPLIARGACSHRGGGPELPEDRDLVNIETELSSFVMLHGT